MVNEQEFLLCSAGNGLEALVVCRTQNEKCENLKRLKKNDSISLEWGIRQETTSLSKEPRAMDSDRLWGGISTMLFSSV